MRSHSWVVLLILLSAGLVSGQLPELSDPAKAPAPPSGTADTDGSEWSFSASVTGYSIPDDKDYLSPLFMADRDWFHLEARHNYEDLDTASLWLGYNFSFGHELVFDFTPMVGGVFGHTRGLAPGWRLALSKGAFELTNETEYFIDAQNSDENFIYMWSELT